LPQILVAMHIRLAKKAGFSCEVFINNQVFQSAFISLTGLLQDDCRITALTSLVE
jgi:hypothetical protein